MDVPSEKPLGKKRALLIAIQHVECKVGSEFYGSKLSDLRFAHQDAETLRDFLIHSHDYDPDDIILMKDDIDYPERLWPTRKKILHQIDQLTRGVSPDGHFFFYYSGHGMETDCDHPSSRANGQDDEIIAADGRPILDHILHDRLIVPLQKVKGFKLFALFDCCHSETLLDLQKGNGPNSYNRMWKYGRDQLFKAIVNVMITLLHLNRKYRRNCNRPPRRTSTKWSSPPVAKTQEIERLSVICVSACRDGQLAHDYGELTFTKCFLEAVTTKQIMTWAELRDAVKRELISRIQAKYEAASHSICEQEPRLSSNSHEDLTKPAMF